MRRHVPVWKDTAPMPPTPSSVCPSSRSTRLAPRLQAPSHVATSARKIISIARLNPVFTRAARYGARNINMHPRLTPSHFCAKSQPAEEVPWPVPPRRIAVPGHTILSKWSNSLRKIPCGLKAIPGVSQEGTRQTRTNSRSGVFQTSPDIHSPEHQPAPRG
jgi:hypothetical protein